jgi:hypothetical protein
VTPGLPSWLAPLQALALVASPRLRLQHILDYVTLLLQPMFQNLNLGCLLFMSSFYKILTSNGMFVLPFACMTSFKLNGTIICLRLISLIGRFFFLQWSWRLGCHCHPKFIVMFSFYTEVFFFICAKNSKILKT